MSHLSDLTHAQLIQRVLRLERETKEAVSLLGDSDDPASTVRVGVDGFRAILLEREDLRRQVTELQEAATKAIDNSLYRVVRRFHLKFNHPVEHTPRVPEDDQVRFRLKLIAEEFFELLDASLEGKGELNKSHVMADINEAPIKVNLPEMVDAMGDLDWVVEGTRAVMGVLSAPVTAEIARANMSKEPAAVAAKDAHHQSTDKAAIKPMKPAGWKPPDIRGELLRQGWRPTLRDIAAEAK